MRNKRQSSTNSLELHTWTPNALTPHSIFATVRATGPAASWPVAALKGETYMNIRERAMAAFRGEIPDRMPWFCDLTYWIAGQRQQGTFPEEYEGGEGYLKLHRDLGVGIYLFPPLVYRSSREQSQFKTSTQREGDTTIQEVHTPEGRLRTVYRYCPASASTATVEYAVRSPEDLRVLRSYLAAQKVEASFENFRRTDTLWGEHGIPVMMFGRTPLARLAVEWCGITNLSYLLADHPEDVEETLALIARKQDAIYEIICGCPAQVVEIGDNLSAETVGGLFKRYSTAYYRKRIERLHAAGKRVGVHLDGTMRGLITELADTGLDFIEAVTPAPVGDVPVEELFSLVNENTVLWGGVPGAMFAPPFTWEDVRSFVEHIIDCHGASGRFVLCSADQVPVNGNIDFVKRISELVESRPL